MSKRADAAKAPEENAPRAKVLDDENEHPAILAFKNMGPQKYRLTPQMQAKLERARRGELTYLSEEEMFARIEAQEGGK